MPVKAMGLALFPEMIHPEARKAGDRMNIDPIIFVYAKVYLNRWTLRTNSLVSRVTPALETFLTPPLHVTERSWTS